jgi:hypothetical protein
MHRAMERPKAWDDPEWDATARAWNELGLGTLSVEVTAPGLVEIRVVGSRHETVPPELLCTLLEGVLERLAGQPVSVLHAGNDEPVTGNAVRFLAGSRRLLPRLARGLSEGRSIDDLIGEIWS